MKMHKFVSSSNRQAVYGFMILVVFAIFLLTGCSSVNESADNTTPPSQENNSQGSIISESLNHDIDTEPVPLGVEDTLISLEGYGAKGALVDSSLSINDMLIYAAQDEYLAHGEYAAIIDKFGSQRPYTNIIRAEETHLAYLKEVYSSYGLDFPADDSADHIAVPADLLEAAETGVQAEIDNIAMYERFLTYDLPENVSDVFTALKKGSDSHLLAFQKQVDKQK